MEQVILLCLMSGSGSGTGLYHVATIWKQHAHSYTWEEGRGTVLLGMVAHKCTPLRNILQTQSDWSGHRPAVVRRAAAVVRRGHNPRKHIWLFAATLDETRSNYDVCPCTKTDAVYTGVIPPFAGQDYFCDTGSRYHYQNRIYSHDPLWNGQFQLPTVVLQATPSAHT